MKFKILPSLEEVTPGQINPENLRNELTFLGEGSFTPANAIKMLCEVAGFREEDIDKLFPNLRGFNGEVKITVSSAGQPPIVISIAEANGNPELWYGYDVTNDRAVDLSDQMDDHPRNKIDRVLNNSWNKQKATLGDPEIARTFLNAA